MRRVMASSSAKTAFAQPQLTESFRKLSGALKLVPNIIEVDGSSLFCEIAVP